MALAGVAVAEEAAEMKEELVPIKFGYAKPVFVSGSMAIKGTQNLEPHREGRPYPPILVPKGCDQLLSRECKVTSSNLFPIRGKLSMVTDGIKDDYLQDFEYWFWYTRLVLGEGLYWIQIDLGEQNEIYAVCVWHAIRLAVFKDVVVLISDDPDFVDGVVTVFNNDLDNTVGFGKGKDFEYLETNEGRPIPANGTKGRYVRCYSNGPYNRGGNMYVQVEVFGRK